MSIGESIKPEMWNDTKQRVKGTHPSHHEINKLLSEIILYVDQVRHEYKIKGERLTASTLNVLINKRLKGLDESMYDDYADKWLASRKIPESTLKTYINAVNVIKKNAGRFTFNDINKQWHTKLLNKLKDYKPNYINLVMRRLYEVIDSAFQDEIHNNKFYQKKGFIPSPVEIDSIYLTEMELTKIWTNLDNLSPSQKSTAITFLIGAWTGQRHQTYSVLDKSMVLIKSDVAMITIKQQKTKAWVSIPITDKLDTLLNHPDRTKQAISKLNINIKEVCKISGIENWALVSSHTARRSYATNRVLEGMELSLIMAITGHKTEKEFRKYVRMDDVLAAVMVNKHNKLQERMV